jgi:hypothetical protein
MINKMDSRVLRISQYDIGPSRKVSWFCKCDGYSLLPHLSSEPPVISPDLMQRNDVIVDHAGGDIISAQCSRCGADWKIYVYQWVIPSA